MADKKKKRRKETASSTVQEPETSESTGKLAKLDSTQMWSPIKDVKEGIIITKDGRYVMVLEFAPINFGLLPAEEQDAIASTFGAAIRTFPKKFQIKVLSRKANIEAHVRNMQACMDAETNDKCRAMQQDTIDQIQRDAVHGVSRRFFLAFEYEFPSGIRRPSWPEVRNSMYFTAQQIASRLSQEPCNNELLSKIGNTDHTLDILYNCLCRNEAELKSLEAKVEDVVAAHVIKNKGVKGLTIPINDFISPRKIDPTSMSYVEVDGKYYSFGYIHRGSYSQRCYAGWMSALVNMGEGVDIDIWVEQKETKDITSKLTYSMQLSQSEMIHKSSSSADLVQLQHKIESEQYIRQGLSNDQTFMYFSTMITVVDDSPGELRAKYKAVQNFLTTQGLELRPCYCNHDLALRSSLPISSPDKTVTRYAQRNILSGDFGAAYPFTSFEINDPGGIRLGRNLVNNSPLFLDPFNRKLYNNGNIAIFGTTGAGKTYLIQSMALLFRQTQTQVIIIAPYKGHEYRPACENIGGSYISLAPGSVQNVNVMEIRKYDTTNAVLLDGEGVISNSILMAKIQQLRTFFSIQVPDLSKAEIRILDEALLDTYAKFGITADNKSLDDPLNPGRYKKMPILGDLDAVLKGAGPGARRLRDTLGPFISGSARNFNGPTNVNLDNPYIVIDISSMPEDMMPIAIFIANDFVYDTIRADRTKKKAIIMDELSRMIGKNSSPEAAKFVLSQAKTVRAYNCILVIATQDINDFFALEDGWYGKGILANTKMKVVMKQESEESKTISEKLGLSPEERRRIVYFNAGEALLIANRNHAEFKVFTSALVHDLITTNPEQLKEKLLRQRKT